MRFMSTATATTRPASSVSVTWPSPAPSVSRSARPRSDQMTSGRPQAFGAMPTSRIQMPCANPVPSALTIASLAAKRIARNRTGRLYARNAASSSGSSSRRTKCSPCRA